MNKQSAQEYEVSRLSDNVAIIDALLLDIDANPDTYITKRLEELNGWITRLPDVPVVVEGVITMKQALSELRDKIVNDPTAFVNEKKEELLKIKQQTEKQIQAQLVEENNVATDSDNIVG